MISSRDDDEDEPDVIGKSVFTHVIRASEREEKPIEPRQASKARHYRHCVCSPFIMLCRTCDQKQFYIRCLSKVTLVNQY